VLAGWSYGVLNILAYVNQHGISNVRAAVIIDGAPRGVGKDPNEEWVWETIERSVEEPFTIRTLENRSMASRQIAQWCLEADSPDDSKWLEAISEQTPDAIAALMNETALYANYEADLKHLTAKRPVLIVAREDWRHVVSTWSMDNAPGAQVEIFGKHMMFWERAETFNSLLDNFLQKI
jgi:pimeloyl-ACP methyl ester carboxylesterase